MSDSHKAQDIHEEDMNKDEQTQATEEVVAEMDTMQETQDSSQDNNGASGDLLAEIERLKAEVQTNLDGWQRSRAEFTNYKRRTQQELAESKQRGALESLSKVLPVIDDFERALDNVPAELKGHAWTNGTALILKNMQKVLDEYGVEIVDPIGQEFDPNFHEAIGTEDSDAYASGVVSTTLQKGYKSGDKVLRPALVKVAN